MKKFYYGYVVAAAAFVIWFTSWGAFSTFSIFLKPISESTGWARADLALAYSLSSLVQAFCALGMGRLTDKLGPRQIVTIFGSLIAIAFILLSLINALWQFQLIYALVSAIGLSTATIPIMATIARWFTKKRGLITGIVQSGMGLGGMILSPLCAWLILNYGWRTGYLVLGLIILPLIIISGLLLRRDPGDILSQRVQASAAPNADNKGVQQSGLSLQEAFKTNQFYITAGMFFCYGFCRATFLSHTAAHVQDLGFTLTDGANVMAALTFSSILGRIGVGFLGDKLGSKNAYAISYSVMVISILWGKFTGHLPGLFLFAVLFGFSWGGQAVLRFTFSAEMFGLAAIGAITGVLGLLEAVGAAIGSFIAGYIFDLVGSYDLMFSLGVGIALLGAVMPILIKPMAKDKLLAKSLTQ